MSLAGPMLVSEAEFLALPESVQRVELVDGEVVVPPSLSLRHQTILRRVITALDAWAEDRKDPTYVGLAPSDIRFARDRILQPDAFVILGNVDTEREGPLDRVPDLCVEVLSRDRVYDRVTKRMIYAASGVAELWTIDTGGMVERWTGEGLTSHEALEGAIRSGLLPGFELGLEQLFRAP